MDRVDAVLEWEAEFSSPTGGELLEVIGDVGGADVAAGIIREFAAMADCDFEVVLPDATTSGGLIEVAGADLAAHLVWESPEFVGARFEILIASRGSIVLLVSQEVPAGTADSSVVAFAELAVRKVGAER